MLDVGAEWSTVFEPGATRCSRSGSRCPLFKATKSPGAGVSHPIRVLLVGAISLMTGLVVAFAISLVEVATDVALYGFSAAVVIPVGAIGCGLVTAVGFSTASRLLHVRPAGTALAIPLITALTSFFAAHWFTFTRYEFPTGVTVADVFARDGLGFIDYLRMTATESGMTLGSSSAPTTIGRLGSWGYGVVALQIIGFALGGWFVSTLLRQKPWCEVSHRFMSKEARRVSYYADADRFASDANRLVDVLERGGPVAAFEHAAVAKPTLKQKRNARFSITTTHLSCSACGARHTVISTSQKANNNNWTKLSQTPLHLEASPEEQRAAQLVS